MSNKEKCISIVNSFDGNQLANIVSLLEAARNAIEEAEDEAFCRYLYDEYKKNPEAGASVSIEDLSQQLGITL